MDENELNKSNDDPQGQSVTTGLSLSFDETGMPRLSLSSPSWSRLLFEVCVDTIRNLFRKKDEEEEIEFEIQRFQSFIKRIKIQIVLNNLGEPSLSIVQEPDPEFGRWARRKYKKKRKKQKKSKKQAANKHRTARMRKIGRHAYHVPFPDDSLKTACITDEEEKPATRPVVIQNKQGTVIYNIQNITINITAEVVNQLNMNPQQVVNLVHDQLQAGLDSALKQELLLKK